MKLNDKAYTALKILLGVILVVYVIWWTSTCWGYWSLPITEIPAICVPR
jgi:hypothetical protein